jgi:hypothetical protein
MATATWAEIRDAAKDALKALLTGGVQEYTVGGSTFTRLDLDKLRALIAEAEAYASEEDGTVRSVVVEFQEGVRG